MLTKDELDRLDRLIGRFNYGAARSILVEAARPCVSLFLDDIPAGPEERAARTLALGASRMGGTPDLPEDMAWPIVEQGFVINGAQPKPSYAGFLLQIALEDMPRIADHPLPLAGQLYVFDLGPSLPFETSFMVLYSAAAKSDLRRAERPADLPCAAEPFCFEAGEALAIRGALGVDFAEADGEGIELYRRVAHAMEVDDLADGLIDAFSAFQTHARDGDADARAARGYPDWWWRVGRLFGAVGRSLDGQADGANPRAPLMTIESNILVGFSSPADEAPIQLSILAGSPRPWTHFDAVSAAMTT